MFSEHDSSHIRITGGDPILHPDVYEIIEIFSKRKTELGGPRIDVETSGGWVVDDQKTREVVRRLKDSGADSLSMTRDYWHEKCNVFNLSEHYNRIKEIAENLDLYFTGITVDIGIVEESSELVPQVTLIGRGRDLPEKYWKYASLNQHEECGLSINPNHVPHLFDKHTSEIMFDPKGNVYLCNSGNCFNNAGLSVGNIYEQSIIEILGQDSNSIVRLLREKGTRGLTELVGMSLEDHYKMHNKMTPCGLCHEMLREYGKEILKRLEG